VKSAGDSLLAEQGAEGGNSQQKRYEKCGLAAELGDCIEKRCGEVLNAQVDRGEETVVHQDDVAAMSVGNGDAALGIEERDVAVDGEALPPGRSEELRNLLIGGRLPRDGRLPDKEAETGISLESANEGDIVSEKVVVEGPALEVVDRGGTTFLAGTMDQQQSEKIGPRRLENRFLMTEEPDLMLVALVVGRSAQFFRRSFEEETVFVDIVEEDSDFLVEIGRTALKARNCFTAAS
jgi:hypothetical protein